MDMLNEAHVYARAKQMIEKALTAAGHRATVGFRDDLLPDGPGLSIFHADIEIRVSVARETFGAETVTWSIIDDEGHDVYGTSTFEDRGGLDPDEKLAEVALGLLSRPSPLPGAHAAATPVEGLRQAAADARREADRRQGEFTHDSTSAALRQMALKWDADIARLGT